MSGNPFHRETDFFIYTAKPKFDLEGRDAMYFTHGDHRAFESLMRGTPGGDHYDSGKDGPYPECRSCRWHRPYRKDRFCKYAECPYTPGRMTARGKGNPPGKGGDAVR